MKKVHHLQRPEVKRKALLIRKGSSLKKEIIKLGIISRTWNIHVLKGDGLKENLKELGHVMVSAPQREMTVLLKALKCKRKATFSYFTTDLNNKKVKWSSIVLPVK